MKPEMHTLSWTIQALSATSMLATATTLTTMAAKTETEAWMSRMMVAQAEAIALMVVTSLRSTMAPMATRAVTQALTRTTSCATMTVMSALTSSPTEDC